jgi:hypothetical protein
MYTCSNVYTAVPLEVLHVNLVTRDKHEDLLMLACNGIRNGISGKFFEFSNFVCDTVFACRVQ